MVENETRPAYIYEKNRIFFSETVLLFVYEPGMAACK